MDIVLTWASRRQIFLFRRLYADSIVVVESPPRYEQGCKPTYKIKFDTPKLMRKSLAALLTLLLIEGVISTAFVSAQTVETPAEADAAPSVVQGSFSLLDGTPVRLRLSRTITSKEAKVGEMVDFEVLDDIKIDDVTVIPKESAAIATITKAKAAGRLGKGGKLDMNIEYVRLITGEKIALRAIKEIRGGNRTGTMTGALIASGLLFFPAAPIFLFIKGKNITLARGTEVTAYVNGDFPLDRARFASSADLQKINVAESANIIVKSTPQGADIEIDGQFVGSTPSTITIMSGDYRITVRKNGYAVWERGIAVAAGSSVTVDASLVKP